MIGALSLDQRQLAVKQLGGFHLPVIAGCDWFTESMTYDARVRLLILE